ncbi:hexose kinase [Virgibacillus sp. M23]|uniref:hexose kinase n=1 Tax=Virgibacillus sp. M23 TaxID=3079030 RepID=UPI002A90CFAB|nr:hexose kinase [Virgibacillus sp. M23]MDY7043184.1 hexose kinase [Virgibacillus sp. M23]
MILTITLNPSVDIRYSISSFQENAINRVTDVSKTAGGKGLNVTRVLHQLEENVAASGFLGGSLGSFISTELQKYGIDNYFTPIKGETRNCIAIIHNGKQTEILESGPEISENEAASFLREFEKNVLQAEVVTISGSLPAGLDRTYYNQMLEIAEKARTPVLLDTKGELLAEALQHDVKPFLIKPNQYELGDLIGSEILHVDEMKQALQLPLFNDISWVVITLGETGAVVKHENNFYHVTTPKINAVNPVGSGDSVIAGFAAGLERKLQETELIRFGITMGVLNAMEEKTGSIDLTKMDWCIQQIKIDVL